MANPRQIRIPDDLWESFGEAVKRQSPELDRSTMIRELIRWYIRHGAPQGLLSAEEVET